MKILHSLQSHLYSLSKSQGSLNSSSPLQRFCRFYGRYNSSTRRVASILHGNHELSTKRSGIEQFRTFYTRRVGPLGKSLPCDSKDLKPLTEEEANALIQQAPGWKLVKKGGKQMLGRTWKAKTSSEADQFISLVCNLVNAEGHYPYYIPLKKLWWNKVEIGLCTTEVDGLTENDFIIAAKINELNSHQVPSNDTPGLQQSTDKDLVTKKCLPLDSEDLKAITETEASVLIQKVPGWSLMKEGSTQKLYRSIKCWNVVSFKRVLDLIKAEGQFPEFQFSNLNVKLILWTDPVDGLSENDFILAAKINELIPPSWLFEKYSKLAARSELILPKMWKSMWWPWYDIHICFKLHR